jgi:signal transduction histidine kinase
MGLAMPDADLAFQRMLKAERLAAVDAAMAALAHDTRNALQRMQSCLTLMKMRGNEEIQVLVDEMQDAQDRLHELYEEFQSAVAPLQLERSEVDVRKLVERVWRQLRLRWSGKALEWIVRVEPGVDTKADVDSQKLGDALRAVLENAIDASPSNGSIVCTFAYRSEGGRAFLDTAIEDFGPCIRDWGVGFAIAQRVVDEHDGTIGVAERHEGGTRIVVTLPRHGS